MDVFACRQTMGRRRVLSGHVCTGRVWPKLVVWHWQYMGNLRRQVHFNYDLLGVRACERGTTGQQGLSAPPMDIW